MTTVDAPAEGPWPLRDAKHLLDRIQALPPDRQAQLQEAWTAHGFGILDPLLTDADYIAREQLINTLESTLTGPDTWARLKLAAEDIEALPPHIYGPCTEALQTFTGITNPRNVDLISTGRLAEIERIVAEAVAYAAQDPGIPSVTELPPAQDTGDLDATAASTEHPGPKAKVDEVLAWVGQDRNRAARAWLHEHDRSSPRKGVVAKLTEVLGPDGVATVEAEIAKHQPPPLDLSAAPRSAGQTESGPEPPLGSEAPPAGEDHREVQEPPPVEVPPAGDVAVADLLVDACDRIATGFAALADALRKDA